MELLASRNSWWMTQCEAVLLAEGITPRWTTPADRAVAGTFVLDVPTSDGARAVELLSEQLGDELEKNSRSVPAGGWVPLFLQPDFAFGLCLSLLLLAFYVVSGGVAHNGDLFRRGAMVVEAFAQGQWWRAITAATLHADMQHALSNAGFLLLLAWAASERFGPGITLFLWLATAVAGFVASFWFSDATLTIGASGGLFGLLGAAGGHGLRTRRPTLLAWRERLRVGGAAVLLLAFTAFSPEANIPAHLGGFVAGMLLGLALPAERRPTALWQLLGGGIATVLVIVAWMRA